MTSMLTEIYKFKIPTGGQEEINNYTNKIESVQENFGLAKPYNKDL
jgi:hypothetical protein